MLESCDEEGEVGSSSLVPRAGDIHNNNHTATLHLATRTQSGATHMLTTSIRTTRAHIQYNQLNLNSVYLNICELRLYESHGATVLVNHCSLHFTVAR